MLKMISTDQLMIGMYLQKIEGSWIDLPFWRRSFRIDDDDTIKTLVRCGITQVWINTKKGIDLPDIAEAVPAEAANDTPAELENNSDPEPPAVNTQSPAKRRAAEMQEARKICEQAKDKVNTMFQQVRMGKAVDIEATTPLVDAISDSVMRNPDALISIARLKTADDYTYMHSVAVCALMVALAKQLDLDAQQTHEAGIGGLIHDLGKALMPLEVLNKPGKLTDEEYRIMQTHPEEGVKLLAPGAVSEDSRDIVLHHHEKFDGTGYPDKLSGEQITLLSRMGAVCDVYDAVTSTRPYKEGWDPAVSLKRMASWKGHFDPEIFRAFVKSLGIYPTGSLVRLESGKLGIVIEQNEESLLVPKVKTFFSAKSKTTLPVTILDLAKKNCQDRVAGVEDPENWNFRNLDDLWAET